MLTDVIVKRDDDGSWDPIVGFTRDAIVSELDLVSRTVLGKKKALRKMLQFVVEATLNSQAASLKEYTIATLVFGKRDDFDPRMTSLVRTQAHKLREVLLAHYSAHPSRRGPWLWIPPGSYQAVFDRNPAHNLPDNMPEATSDHLPVTNPGSHASQPTVLARGSDRIREDLLAHYSAPPGPTGPWLWIPPGSNQAVLDRDPSHNQRDKIPEATSGNFVTNPRCHVSPPTVLARGSDLSSIASEVVRLQCEHPAWGRCGASMPVPMRSLREGMTVEPRPPFDFEVKHTIVELDDSLLVTAYLLTGKENSVIFGRSFSVGWAGNPVATISRIAPELSAFISAVGMIIAALGRCDC